MLGLPATTEVGRRLPKEAFYRHLDVDAATRRDLTGGVASIIVANSIKPATTNIADGKAVHEILVLWIDPKGERVPERAVRLVSNATPNKAVIVDGGSGDIAICEEGRLLEAQDVERLALNGFDLDMVWDSMLAQVALGEFDGHNVWERIDRREKIDGLRAEVSALNVRCRKERQIARKNELFRRMRSLEKQIEELEKGEDFR